MKKEKKTHGVQLLFRAVVTDPDGKVISDTGEKPSKSFVIQFLEFIKFLFDRVALGVGNATDIFGAEVDIYLPVFDCNTIMRIDAPVNEDAYGVLVGTGETPETNTDIKLETQLTEGLGAGNITHGEVDIGTTAVVGANVDLEILRAFINNTGSTITVKEAGIYVKEILDPYYHCIIRDVLGTPVDIPDRCGLSVYYTMRTTV